MLGASSYGKIFLKQRFVWYSFCLGLGALGWVVIFPPPPKISPQPPRSGQMRLICAMVICIQTADTIAIAHQMHYIARLSTEGYLATYKFRMIKHLLFIVAKSPASPLFSQPFMRRSKKTSKLRVTGHCVGNSPVSGEFLAQTASNAENVSIWWRHHILDTLCH